MADFKIILYLLNGFTLMQSNTENKTYQITRHMKEESKYYKSKAKDGMKLMFIYCQMRLIYIMSRMSRNRDKENKIMNKIFNCNKEFRRLAIILHA